MFHLFSLLRSGCRSVLPDRKCSPFLIVQWIVWCNGNAEYLNALARIIQRCLLSLCCLPRVCRDFFVSPDRCWLLVRRVCWSEEWSDVCAVSWSQTSDVHKGWIVFLQFLVFLNPQSNTTMRYKGGILQFLFGFIKILNNGFKITDKGASI